MLGFVKSRLLQTFRVVALSLVAVVFVACSDSTRTPPDDDEGSVQHKAACAQESAFAACAASVLAESGLSQAEKDSLSSCLFEQQELGSEFFEAARAAVRAECL